MRISLNITYTDGTSRDVISNAADIVAFEDKFNTSIVKIGEEPRMSWMLYLAWHAEKRTGNTKDNFDTWCDKVDAIGESDEDPKSEG